MLWASMSVRNCAKESVAGLSLLLLCAAGARAQGEVKACAALPARLTAEQANASDARLDTARIQQALELCSPGRAVVLKSDAGRTAFASAPLIIPRGVTLFVDTGVTLYASRELRDYSLAPGGCGAAPAGKAAVCKPFLFAYQAAFSGVSGGGVIDGLGGETLTGQNRSWWGLVREAERAGTPISVPDLVSSYESQGFALRGITLRNAPGVHAAIFKTTAPEISGVKIESPPDSAASAGILLSNATGGSVTGAWVRVPADALALKSSILGPTTDITVRDVHIFGGNGIARAGDASGVIERVTFEGGSPDGAYSAFSSAPGLHITLDLSDMAAAGSRSSLVVAPDGSAAFSSIQKAVDALPVSGGEITVRPGTYREVVTIRKPHIRLHGEAPDPARATIVYNNGASTAGGTFNTATVFVEADDVTLDHLSIVNDLGPGKGQAVALAVTADRAIFRNLRILGAQDTLFAASRYCYGDYGPCPPARQYFADSYIEGNVDFIFGDSKAVFERCELHGIDAGSVMYTAQSRHTAEQQQSGYVFDHCRLSGAPRRDGVVSLGRPWRPYATVVFLHAQIDAPVIPAGWTEWLRFGKPSLPTAFYAEYQSTGPGANPKARDPHSHQLTQAEAAQWSPRRFLAGQDGWDPTRRDR
jgi:pectinesterase